MNMLRLAAAMDSLLDKIAEGDEGDEGGPDSYYAPVPKRTRTKTTLGRKMTAEEFEQIYGFLPTPNQLKAFRAHATRISNSLNRLHPSRTKLAAYT
jgi:hypothetical protein